MCIFTLFDQTVWAAAMGRMWILVFNGYGSCADAWLVTVWLPLVQESAKFLADPRII